MEYLEDLKQEGAICPKCNKGRMQIKKGKFGSFLGCSEWPLCGHVENKGVNLQQLASSLLKARCRKRRRGKKRAR